MDYEGGKPDSKVKGPLIFGLLLPDLFPVGYNLRPLEGAMGFYLRCAGAVIYGGRVW